MAAPSHPPSAGAKASEHLQSGDRLNRTAQIGHLTYGLTILAPYQTPCVAQHTHPCRALTEVEIVKPARIILCKPGSTVRHRPSVFTHLSGTWPASPRKLFNLFDPHCRSPCRRSATADKPPPKRPPYLERQASTANRFRLLATRAHDVLIQNADRRGVVTTLSTQLHRCSAQDYGIAFFAFLAQLLILHREGASSRICW